MPNEKKVSNTQKEQTTRVLRLVYEQAQKSLVARSETLAAVQLQEIQRTNPTYAKLIEADKKLKAAEAVRNAAGAEFEAASKEFHKTMGSDFHLSYRSNTRSLDQLIMQDLALRLRGILREKLNNLKSDTEIQILLVDTDASLTEILRTFQEAVSKLGE